MKNQKKVYKNKNSKGKWKNSEKRKTFDGFEKFTSYFSLY